MIKIDKGIPPPSLDDKGSKLRYPFPSMEIGDSFLVPLNGEPNILVRNRLSNMNKRFAPRRFTARYVESEDGIRVWRIG